MGFAGSDTAKCLHPAFGRSFSLKRVVAPIPPDMRYEGLDAADGSQAGIVWTRLVDAATVADEKAELKPSLLEYCGQDTLVLARITAALGNNIKASAG